MADFFARLTYRAIPVQFDQYSDRRIGIPRIYSLGRDGLLVGTNTTTYGFDFAGNFGGSRPRSVAEAGHGDTGLSSPTAVGRLWDGKTLWQPAYRRLIGAGDVLTVGTVGGASATVVPPAGAGRQFATCVLSPDGRHMFYLTAPAGSINGSATCDQWHLARWTGTAFALVSSGTVAVPAVEYLFGPGSSSQAHGAGMIESDLETIWDMNRSSLQLNMYRIGADNVLRLIRSFSATSAANDAELPYWLPSAYPAVFADKGLCAVVAYSQLAIFTRLELAPEPVYTPPKTPVDGYGLRLAQIDNGCFDLAFYDPVVGDGPAVETLVYAVLFSDAEAPVSREPDRYLRRGWWADPEAGSGLWHIRRQPLGSAARREAVAMVREALERYGLTEVSVVEQGPAGVSRVSLEVSGIYRDKPFIVSVPL